MYPLFESIQIKDGKVLNINWHQQRYERSFQALYHKKPLGQLIDHVTIPETVHHGVYKLRISYNEQFKKIEFEPYAIKPINSLKLVHVNTMSYDLKFSDRKALLEAFKQKEECDDVLMIKNGFVTDTSYANIVFYNGTDWVTPSSPLLHGTARTRLLEEGRIIEKEIKLEDITSFDSFKLVNALRDFGSVESVYVASIKR